jgi:transcriptional regulator with XRE-family HTH domain
MSAKQLRQWRERMEWTQQKAAEYLGCSTRHYQRYEAGVAVIPTMVTHSVELANLTLRA